MSGPPRGPPPRGPPPNARGPPGRGPPPRGPPGGPPRGPPPGAIAPPGRGPPRGPPNLSGGPPRGLPPGRGPPSMGPPGRGPPGRGPPGRGPPGRGPPGRGPPSMGPPGRGPPRGPPGRGAPGRGPPGRGPPGRGPPRGPPGRGPPGRGPPARGPLGAAGPPGRGPPRGPARGLPPVAGGPRAPPGGPPLGPPRGQAAPKKFGKLTIKVIKGKELKTASAAGQSDPYVKIVIGQQEFSTNVVKGGGANPTFEEDHTFDISTEKELTLEVWDKEQIGGDRLIGRVKTSFLGWIGKGNFTGDLDIKDDKNAPAGAVQVVATFERPSGQAPPPPGAAPPRGPPQMGPPGAAAGTAAEAPRDPNGKFSDQEIKEAFMAFDLDHNNFVGAAEIRHVLINIGENVTDDEVDEMIRMVDSDGDGQVSFAEFYEMVSGGKTVPTGLWDGPGGGGPPQGIMAPQAGVARPEGVQAATIQQRNQRKNALDDFAREYNIKPESIKRAYKRFQETDVDHSGLIDYTEFCEILSVDPSPQVEKLFQLFDTDKSGQIDVKEFMIGLSNFTGAGKDEKLKFAFMVFDEDGNGVITKQELLKILKANHMAGTEKEVLRKAETIMMQADKDGDGVISFDEFVIVSKKFPNILFPAYSLGAKLQDKLG